MTKPACLLLPLVLLPGSCTESRVDHALGVAPTAGESDPPEIQAGERLFLETRFARFFADAAGGNLNLDLAAGDPALDRIVLDGVSVASPFAGRTMSCTVCHMVDQALDLPGGGVRTYGDFAVRSAITARPDGLLATPRNSPPLVNASIPRSVPVLFHRDGEFASLETLAAETLLGRNYGWLPSERREAIAHIAAVVRQDDGAGELASEFGSVRYADLLDLSGGGVPEELRLPDSFRLDVAAATDLELVGAVAALIAAYTEDLAFSRDDRDRYDATPFDTFLARNGLPRQLAPGESPRAFSARLAAELDRLADPVFLVPGEREFEFHDQEFAFGAEELEGLRIFLRTDPVPERTGGVGNCVACHAAPDFTDFLFHNAGFVQAEYDSVHGPGAFALLFVPDLAERNASPETWLPPSPAHPDAAGPFRAEIDPAAPMRADLGLWNVFANPAVPGPQAAIGAVLDEVYGAGTSALPADRQLELTLGLFKTPGLRDLGHSAPYGHAGHLDTLGDVLVHYLLVSGLARGGFVRNADPELERIELVAADLAPLLAFLRSLDEDYD